MKAGREQERRVKGGRKEIKGKEIARKEDRLVRSIIIILNVEVGKRLRTWCANYETCSG